MMEKSTANEIGKRGSNSAINRREYLKLAGIAGSGVGTGVGASALGTEFTTPARAETTIVDDFNDTNLSGRYVFDNQNAATSIETVSSPVTSDADTNVLQMEGDGTTQMYAFKGDGDTDLNAYPEIGDTFSCWLRGRSGAENMNVHYGAQDMDNKYYVKLNLAEGHLGLFAYDGGSAMTFTGDWSNSSIQNTTGWYELEIDWTTEHEHTVTLYQNGSEVTSFSYTESSNEPQHTASGIGFAAYLSSGETAQFDYATTSGTTTPKTESYYKLAEDFEDRKLENPYSFDRGKDSASITSWHNSTYNGPQPLGDTYYGTNALKLSESNTEMISLPGDGLNAYPSAGDTFSCYFMPTGGVDNLNFTWAVQSHDSRYYVKVKPKTGSMYLFKYKGGNGTVLGSASGISMSQDTWYWLEVHWDTDGTQTVELYNLQGNVLATCQGSDSEWTSGGIGFDAYLGSGSSVFFDGVKVGSYEGHIGGWGPEVMASTGNDPDYSSCCTLYEDFNFAFKPTGQNEDDPEEFQFAFGGLFHTFVADDNVENPTADQIHFARRLEKTGYELNVTGPDGGDVSDDVQLKRYNTAYTHLTPQEWEEWKDSSIGEEATREEIRANAIDNNVIDEKRSGVGWGDIGATLLSGIGYRWYPPASFVGLLLSGANLVYKMEREKDCGSTLSSPDSDYDATTWDPCDNQFTLMAYITEFDLNVPLGERIGISLNQSVTRSDNHGTTENKAVWEVYITEDENMVLDDENSRLTR